VVVSSSSSSPSPPSQNGIDAEEENGKKKKKKLQRHVKGVRPQYKNLEGPGGALQSFDATLPVEVDISRKALYKAARKAVEDYEYEQILQELQIELVFFQEWVKEAGLKVAVIFEGRDAAGKGGCIARITDAMSPRVCKVVALAAPSPAEKTQWYFQRYIKHLPSAGEVVLFDRSWYNRAGVERVMGFCTDEELDEFYRTVPQLEEMITNSGTILIKLWFDVSDQEQEKRFQKRLNRSWKRWKLSPMDLFARSKWFEYQEARDVMFEKTGGTAPWTVIPSDNKKLARLNAISHILSSVPYKEVGFDDIELPPREEKPVNMKFKSFVESDNARYVRELYTEEGLSTDDDGTRWSDLAANTLLANMLDDELEEKKRKAAKAAKKKGSGQ